MGPVGNEPILVGTELSKIYQQQEAVDFVLDCPRLEARAGEIVAIVGRSGSGKSTLVQILGLLQQPDGGTLHVLGRDVLGLARRDRADFRAEHIGLVFQAFNLLPQLTAQQNVALASRGRQRDAAKEARRLLDTVGLGHRLDARPGEMSGGEQQRAALARAFINGPEVLIADEPTGNLDEANETLVMDLLAEYARQGHVVLLVTHSARLAEAASRVVALDAGVATCRAAVGGTR